jgi:hypothetical protein
MFAMQNYSKITREPDCFERQGLTGHPSVNPGVAGVGIGPILRSGENDKGHAIETVVREMHVCAP